MILRLLAVLAILALCGCDRFDTRYGVREASSHSVNGLRVLDARLATLGGLATFPRLSPHAAERDVLVHVATMPGLPDEQACTWISDWLKEAPRRQFVLVLRDGNVAPWLCLRWAAEAHAEAARADGSRRAELEGLAERLDHRARQEDEPPLYGPGLQRECPLFRLHLLRNLAAYGGPYGAESMPPPHGMPVPPLALPDDHHPERFAGLVDYPTPAMFSLNSAIEAAAGTPLVSADGDAWAMAIPFGRSRLVVIANATPLLDGAQVDLRARRLLAAVVGEIGTWKPRRLAWVDSLVTHPDSDPEPPNLLAMLFGKAPFCYAAYHLLGLMLVFVAWKATWLGRVEARPDRTVERFMRHVEALAFHLRRERSAAAALAALARALGRPAPPITRDPAAALALARALHHPPTASVPAPDIVKDSP
jgi:hypothetical protein